MKQRERANIVRVDDSVRIMQPAERAGMTGTVLQVKRGYMKPTLAVVRLASGTLYEIPPALLEVLPALCTEGDDPGKRLLLSQLSDVARGAGDFIKVDSEGKVTVDLQAIQEAGKGHIIKSMRVTALGVNVQFHDSQEALEILGMHHGLFADRSEVTIIDSRIDQELEGIAESMVACVK